MLREGKSKEPMNSKQSLIDLFIHDLTGPLSIVSTSTRSLLDKQDKYGPITDRQKMSLNLILRNVHKAQTFLNEIIEIYRSEEGVFRKGPCSMRNILKESLLEAMEFINPDTAEKLLHKDNYEEFHRFLGDNGVMIDIAGKYSASPFYHDEKKIHQILRNLITNALKYRREKVKIAINGDIDLIIAVEDDGPGISLEKQDFVFKRFSQIKDENDKDLKGLGFGLSCVKTIVETMSGSIRLSSEEGAGTRFVVQIPPLQQ